MTSASKNMYIDKLADILNEYTNKYHCTTKMKPPGRQVGLFRHHIRKNTKKYTLQSKHKYIKNTMATGIAQKSYKALFLLWSLKKNDILKLIN